MCGRHRSRPGGGPLLWVLLGAFLAATPARAEDAGDPSDDDDSAAPDEEPPSTSATVEVHDHRATPEDRAHRAPETAHVVTIDESTPPSTTVAEALESVPGVTVRRLGGRLDPSFVRIRGATARQVAVFVDGMPLNAFGASTVDLSELALFAFDRLEVHRGFAPARLGGFAIGGAVNLVTDPDRPPRPAASVSTGSWGARAARASGGATGRLPDGARGQVRAFLGYDATRGDYDAFNHNGTLYNRRDDRVAPRQNNAAQRVSGHVGLRARSARVDASLWDLGTWFDGGVPGAYAAKTTQTRFATAQNVLRGQLVLRPAPWLRVDAGLGWQLRWEQYQDPVGELGTGLQDEEGLFSGLSGSVTAELTPLPWLSVQGAARFDAASYAPSDHRSPDPLPRHARFAPQAQLDARLTPWDGRLELRGTVGLLAVLDRQLDGAPDPPHDLVEVLPGLALALRPWPALTVHASVARGVRPPTLLELFGDRGSSIGNPALRPEDAVQVDGGLRLRGAPWSWLSGSLEAGAFLVDTRDFIVFVPNAQRVAVPINLGATRAAGLEAQIEGSVLDHVDLRVGLTTFLHSRIEEGAPGLVGNRVPGVPTWQVDAAVSAHVGTWIRVGWRFTYTSGTFDSPSNFFEQAPRPIHDLSLRAQPGPLWPWITLEVTNVADTTMAAQVRNPKRPRLTDRAVVPLQDFRGQPLPGRGVLVTVGWSPDPPALRRQRRPDPGEHP